VTARRASDVQRSVAYVLAARSQGVPSRLIVGFRPGVGRAVRGADARVWPEVFIGDRWLTVTIPAAGSRVQDAGGGDGARGSARPSSSAQSPGPRPRDRRLLLLRGAAVLALIVALLLGMLLLRQARARAAEVRARRGGPPSERVRAAWLDVVVRLGERLRLPGSFTAAEVVAAGRPVLGPDAVRDLENLAQQAARVRFGGEHLDERAATEAWRQRDVVASALRRRRRRGPVSPATTMRLQQKNEA
jgi:hypothetical protein